MTASTPEEPAAIIEGMDGFSSPRPANPCPFYHTCRRPFLDHLFAGLRYNPRRVWAGRDAAGRGGAGRGGAGRGSDAAGRGSDTTRVAVETRAGRQVGIAGACTAARRSLARGILAQRSPGNFRAEGREACSSGDTAPGRVDIRSQRAEEEAGVEEWPAVRVQGRLPRLLQGPCALKPTCIAVVEKIRAALRRFELRSQLQPVRA